MQQGELTFLDNQRVRTHADCLPFEGRSLTVITRALVGACVLTVCLLEEDHLQLSPVPLLVAPFSQALCPFSRQLSVLFCYYVVIPAQLFFFVGVRQGASCLS